MPEKPTFFYLSVDKYSAKISRVPPRWNRRNKHWEMPKENFIDCPQDLLTELFGVCIPEVGVFKVYYNVMDGFIPHVEPEFRIIRIPMEKFLNIEGLEIPFYDAEEIKVDVMQWFGPRGEVPLTFILERFSVKDSLRFFGVLTGEDFKVGERIVARLIIDLLEKALPFFERVFPEETRLRTFLEAYKLQFSGTSSLRLSQSGSILDFRSMSNIANIAKEHLKGEVFSKKRQKAYSAAKMFLHVCEHPMPISTVLKVYEQFIELLPADSLWVRKRLFWHVTGKEPWEVESFIK